MLETNGQSLRETVHEAGNGGALLGHGDENFPWLTIGIQTHGDVALMPSHTKLVRQ